MELDELTLARAVKGDKAAFETIVETYGDKIYGVCLRMLGNAQDAQDCAQDVFIKVYQSLPRFEKRSNFSTWLYRIATNASLDMLRKRKSGIADSLDELSELGFSPAQSEPGPEETVMRRLTAQQVDQAIAQLPDDQRAVIVLRDIQGVSYDEIARITESNLNTVKSRISRGRQALRRILTGKRELFEFPGV